MDDGWVVGVQKDHASGDLACDADTCGPGDSLVGLVEQVEEG
jgi:hypothetical protein